MFAKIPSPGLAAVCLLLTACNAELAPGPMHPVEQPDGSVDGQQDAGEPGHAPDALPAEPDALPAEPDALPAEPDALPAEPDAMPAEPAVRPPDVCGPFDPPAVAQADVQLIEPLPDVGPDCEAIIGPPRPVRHGPHAASMPLPEACDNASNYTLSGAADGSPFEVHVISVARGIELPDGIGGAVEVTVERTAKPVVLVLSADGTVRWRLRPAPDARIAGVVITGDVAQSVEGSPVPVQALRRGYFCDHAHGWELRHAEDTHNHPAMMRAIRAALGQTETCFQGCDTGARFTVPYAECPALGAPEPEPLDEAIHPGDVDLGACGAIAEESLFCATNTVRGLELIGLDTGTRCVVGPPDGAWQTLTWLGEAIYGCGERGVKRFRFDTRTWEFFGLPCESLTVDDGDLLVSLDLHDVRDPAGGVFRYAGAAGLLADQLLERFGPRDVGRHMDADRGVLYIAEHSTHELERFDMARGVELPPVQLQDYADWVFGLDVIDGRIVIMNPEGIYAFDAADGSALFDFPMRRSAYTGWPAPAPRRGHPEPSAALADPPPTAPRTPAARSTPRAAPGRRPPRADAPDRRADRTRSGRPVTHPARPGFTPSRDPHGGSPPCASSSSPWPSPLPPPCSAAATPSTARATMPSSSARSRASTGSRWSASSTTSGSRPATPACPTR